MYKPQSADNNEDYEQMNERGAKKRGRELGATKGKRMYTSNNPSIANRSPSDSMLRGGSSQGNGSMPGDEERSLVFQSS